MKKNLMRSLTAERRAMKSLTAERKESRGRKREREKRREREDKKVPCMSAHRRRYFYWGKFNYF